MLERCYRCYASGPNAKPSSTAPCWSVWATEDRIMPREHGPRLARLFPDARLIEVEDSYTLIPEDQPDLLIHDLRDFLRP